MAGPASASRARRPRRICFVLDSAHLAFTDERMAGGAETQIRTLGERLAAQGHDVSVASQREFCHPLLRSRTSDSLRRVFLETRPELVIATVAMKTSLRALFVAKSLGLHTVYRLATTEESTFRIGSLSGGGPVSRLAMRVLLRQLADRIWCQHDEQLRNLRNRGLGSRCFVAPNLTEDRFLDPPGEHRDLVLWVGRFHANKVPERFLELAARLDRPCRMISPGVPPEFLDRASRLPHLEITDYVPHHELGAIYARARVLISTSEVEGSPNTMIEAACQGTPTLSTSLDPGGFLQRFGHGSVIVDDEDLLREIDRLFREDAYHAEVSARARRYFETIHDLDVNFGGFERSLFEGLDS